MGLSIHLFILNLTCLLIFELPEKVDMPDRSLKGASIQFRKDVFVNGQDGYDTYRIPALVSTNKGTLLAFCEGRKDGHEDTGNIDLLLKRSNDGGMTWSDYLIVYEEGGDQPVTIGNPVPIVDESSGKIHLLFTKDYSEIYHTFSMDDGMSWSSPINFSSILQDFEYEVVVIATGPGHGIITSQNRLIVPVWVCDRTRKERYKHVNEDRMKAGVIYSDDSGATWSAGGLVPSFEGLTHEATIVERSDGALLLNSRTYKQLYRAESISNDGGLNWSAPLLNTSLPDPTCHGSMLAMGESKQLFFLNPSVASLGGIESRYNLTLRRSYDDGKSWADSLQLNPGPSGYSDMALSGGKLLAIFENGEKVYREKISIISIKID